MTKTIILDSRVCEESSNALKNMGYHIEYMPENQSFDYPVCAHPDIFITLINNKIFADSYIKDLFIFEKEVFFCKREAGDSKSISYPNDCAFNCVSVGNNLICNTKNTQKEILEYAKCNCMNILHTNQGYTKCSVCKISENAIITEDTGIYRIAEDNGIDALLIDKGCVQLDGYEYGFFGGCTGLIEDNLLAVNGDINKHQNADKILNFCANHNVEIICLNNNKLYDIGTILKI